MKGKEKFRVREADQQGANTFWHPMSERPLSSGRYLIYARSADPERPLITVAWYDTDDGTWLGIIPYWLRAASHWMPLPPPPTTRALRLDKTKHYVPWEPARATTMQDFASILQNFTQRKEE